MNHPAIKGYPHDELETLMELQQIKAPACEFPSPLGKGVAHPHRFTGGCRCHQKGQGIYRKWENLWEIQGKGMGNPRVPGHASRKTSSENFLWPSALVQGLEWSLLSVQEPARITTALDNSNTLKISQHWVLDLNPHVYPWFLVLETGLYRFTSGWL